MAGEVFERSLGVAWAGLDLGGPGKREKVGEALGPGDVARRGLGSSSSLFWRSSSLIVFSRSRVACRRARSDEDEFCVPRTPPNMTLYRSILMLGISMSRSDAFI